MSEVMTVRGPISSDELGVTSMHEHILWDGRVYRQKYEALLPGDPPVAPDDQVALNNFGLLQHNFMMSWDACTMRDEEVMAAEASDFRASGGNAMLDMSAPGLRCDLPGIRRISEKSDVHIIATTGLYMEDCWPERFRSMTVEQYIDYMKGEITSGIEDTGIKPGHIKVAIEKGFSEQEERLLRAAARVVNETGYSMTVHLGVLLDREAGLRIAELLLAEGIDPGRAVICHIQGTFTPGELRTLVLDPESWRLRLDIAERLLDLGFVLSVDCFGHRWDTESLGFVDQTDWQRLAGLVALVRSGYSERLVVGTDTFLKIVIRRFGGEGYCRLTNFVIPALKRLEVSGVDIRRITVDNPARLLSRA
jgi:phosphotriesterase-related protein